MLFLAVILPTGILLTVVGFGGGVGHAQPGQAQTGPLDGIWQGVWDTTYGPILLRQDGRRVWGDYVDAQGLIEARTTPDGTTLRGTYMRGDDTWGWFQFTLTDADRWSGPWRWNDLPGPGDSTWDGARRSGAAEPALSRALGPGPFWPPTYAGAPFGRHGVFAFGPDGVDPHGRSAPMPAPTPMPTPTPTPGLVVQPWYGTFDTDLVGSGYGVSVSVDDLFGPAQGIVDLAFFAPAGPLDAAMARCPEALHPDFCAELFQRFSPDTSTRFSLDITVVGATITPAHVTVAFRLAGDTAPRVLHLSRAAPGGPALHPLLMIYHPFRGVDLRVMAARLPHICEAGTCTARYGAQTRLDPGPLADPGFAQAYRVLPDDRARAHRAATGRTPGPVVLPTPSPQAPSPQTISAIAGEFYLTDDAGRWLGQLSLVPTGEGRLQGGGTVLIDGQPRDVVVTAARRTADAAGLTLAVAIGTGEPALRLLIGLQGDTPVNGTLVRGGDWTVIRFTRLDGPGSEEFDLPGVGVFGPAYRLRNTAGNSVVLRAGPRSDAARLGSLPGSATGILVLGCSPDIDSLLWEQSIPAVQLGMLDAVWCEVDHDAGRSRGWLPGFFLEPILQ